MTDEEKNGSDHDKLLAVIIRQEFLSGQVTRLTSLIESELLPGLKGIKEAEAVCSATVGQRLALNDTQHLEIRSGLRGLEERVGKVEDAVQEFRQMRAILTWVLIPATAILTTVLNYGVQRLFTK